MYKGNVCEVNTSIFESGRLMKDVVIPNNFYSHLDAHNRSK